MLVLYPKLYHLAQCGFSQRTLKTSHRTYLNVTFVALLLSNYTEKNPHFKTKMRNVAYEVRVHLIFQNNVKIKLNTIE